MFFLDLTLLVLTIFIIFFMFIPLFLKSLPIIMFVVCLIRSILFFVELVNKKNGGASNE